MKNALNPSPVTAPSPASRPRMWHYTAIDSRAPLQRRHGELSGESAAQVRAALRRIGLQVIELKAVRSRPIRSDRSVSIWSDFVQFTTDRLNKHLRNRRIAQRAEFYDSLATMLSAGLPLLEAMQTLIESRRRSRRSNRAIVLTDLREQLKSGQSLAAAMAGHPGWFDAMDTAIVEAGQHAGNLPQVLASMAQRQQKSNELGQKLIGALAYPALVLIVGIGVAVFLSIKTLPELSKILTDASIPVPTLTKAVMSMGQSLVHSWLTILIGMCCIAGICIAAPIMMRRWRLPWPVGLRSIRIQPPRILRVLAVGGLAERWSELLRSGVPMVEAMRVLTPTVSNTMLRGLLTSAAERIERGEELFQALNDEHWFDAEFRRLLDIGQASGELEIMLQRLGDRYQRHAQRLISRLTTLLEPLVILALATLVGVVVMAAVLPVIRLQEIL